MTLDKKGKFFTFAACLAVIILLIILYFGVFDILFKPSYSFSRLLEKGSAGFEIDHNGDKKPLTDAVQQVRFKRVVCEGFKVPLGNSMEVMIRPPKKAVLCFGCALVGPGHKRVKSDVQFRVYASSEKGKISLFEDRLPSGDNPWEEYEVDLRQLRGKRTKLIFETTIPPGKDLKDISAIWLDPVIYTPDIQDVPFNVILVSIDALRADHLGCYGYQLPTSPNLDKIAEKGILFERAYAHSCWTLPSHVTMLSSLPPEIHRIDMRKERIPESVEFISEILQQKGYATAAFVGGGFVNPHYGWVQGFSRYYHFDKHTGKIFGTAADWIGNNKNRPFFAFIHTLEVHRPYSPPQKYIRLFEEDYSGPLGDSIRKDEDIPEDYSPADRDHVIALYDAGIRSADDYLQTLVDFLDENKLLSNTILVITADHGESLFEHGLYMKHITLNGEVIHVPLIIQAPTIKGGRRSPYLAGIKDIAPTIFELLGEDFLEEKEKLPGKPLLSKDGDFVEQNEEIISLNDNRGQKWISILENHYHYIVSLLTGEEQFYDLKADPKEEHNLVKEEDPALLERFRKKNLSFLENFKVGLLLDFSPNDSFPDIQGEIGTDTIFLNLKPLKGEESVWTEGSPDRKKVRFKVSSGPEPKMLLLEAVDFNVAFDIELMVDGQPADPSLIQLGRAGENLHSSRFRMKVLESTKMTLNHKISGKSKKERQQIMSAEDIFLSPENIAEIGSIENAEGLLRIFLIRQQRLRAREEVEMDEKLVEMLRSLGYIK